MNFAAVSRAAPHFRRQVIQTSGSRPRAPRTTAKAVSEFDNAELSAFGSSARTPEGQLGAAGTIRARNRKWKSSLGDEWAYTRSRWKTKMETPDKGDFSFRSESATVCT